MTVVVRGAASAPQAGPPLWYFDRTEGNSITELISATSCEVAVLELDEHERRFDDLADFSGAEGDVA